MLRDIPLGEVLDLLDLDELYRLQWGGRGSGPQYEEMLRDVFQPTLARLKTEALRGGWLEPAAVYGYFPVQSQGNALIVYDPAAYRSDGGSLREIARFQFPRQEDRERLCLADYFRSVDSGDVDVAAFQIVTVGDAATRRFDTLQASDQYSEAYFSHGVAVEAAEATAEWMHRRITPRIGLTAERGEALLVGLRRLSRSGRSHASVQAAPRRVRVRHAADKCLPVGAGAVHGGDHRASPGCQILHRA